MQRSNPTSRLISGMFNGNYGLASSAHHGLYETPLTKLYSSLNLDEAIAFAASSWMSRKKSDHEFRAAVELGDAHTIFAEALRIGRPWLRKHRHISEDLQDSHERLNPFDPETLEQRLDSIDQVPVEELRYTLLEPVNQYEFDRTYERAKALRDGDNYRLVVMNFMPAFPIHGSRQAEEFAKEIARMLRKYPREHITRVGHLQVASSEANQPILPFPG